MVGWFCLCCSDGETIDHLLLHCTVTHEDVLCSTDQLLEKFVNSLFDWSRVWGLSTAASVTDFIVSLSFVSVSTSIL